MWYNIVMHGSLHSLKRFTASSAKKLKVSKVNDIKTCRLSENVFSYFAILFEEALRDSCPTVKPLVLSSTSGETQIYLKQF